MDGEVRSSARPLRGGFQSQEFRNCCRPPADASHRHLRVRISLSMLSSRPREQSDRAPCCHPEHCYAGSGGDTRIDITARPPSRRDACSTKGGLINRMELWGSRPGCRVGGSCHPDRGSKATELHGVIPTEGAKRPSGGIYSTRSTRSGQARAGGPERAS